MTFPPGLFAAPAIAHHHSPSPHQHAEEHAHLKETINNIGDSCEGHRVTLGAMADSIEMRDFGLLLVVPALIVLLPVSIIPGISSLCAAITLFAGFHILFGREVLWLPERARNISFNGSRVTRALGKMGPVAKKMDRLSRPRFSFMTTGFAAKLVSAIVIILAGATIFLGFIPFIDMAFMLPVVFFGLGSYTQDGLITGIGWLVLVLSIGSIGFLA
jgi:hypothetical protein